MTNKEITLCFAYNLLTLPEDPRGFEKWQKRTNANARRAKNPEPFRRALRKWRANISPESHEKVLAGKRKWCAEDYALQPEKYLPKTKAWNRNNRAKVNERRRQRRIEEPAYKIEQNCRKRIWDAVRGLTKAAATRDLVGCSAEKLMGHIEKQFKPGMTWENYGPRWHVDHKKPCASFDLTDPEQQRSCFHYTNLQPLWAFENLEKGDTCPNE